MELLFLSLILSSFIPFIFAWSCLIISLILLFPLEYLIRNYYFLKAKRKLKKTNALIIGITGSYGKTSFRCFLKDFLSCKYQVLTPKGNINTPLGICRYINNTNIPNNSILILELGIDKTNGMKRFKPFLKLDYAFITSIGENHLSSFKSKENIIKGKLKIKDLLKNKASLYLNGDDEVLKQINIESNKFFPLEISDSKLTKNGLDFIYNNHHIFLPIYGEYVYSYLGGIVNFGKELNMDEDEIILGIKQIKQIDRRMNVKKWKNGYIIDDSYNINLEGVNEAIKVLNLFDGKSIIITGGIIEQGKNYVDANMKLYELIKEYDVIFIGNSNHIFTKLKFKKFIRVKKLSEAISVIEKLDYNNALILAKGEDIYLK